MIPAAACMGCSNLGVQLQMTYLCYTVGKQNYQIYFLRGLYCNNIMYGGRGGLVVSVPASGSSVVPGIESWPKSNLQGGLWGGRSHWEYCTN